MSFGGLLYATASRGLGLVLPWVMARRVASGKEDATRLNERYARDLPPRPAGKLAWLHGASVGESMVLLGVAEALLKRADLSILMTSQTRTSAEMLARRLPAGVVHQMAPADTPASAKRFMAHWRPDLVVFAEGEIWPNLLGEAKAAEARLALVNARMTKGSRKGWARFSVFSRKVFGGFDTILAADKATAETLQQLGGKPVLQPGNLKSALPPPLAAPDDLDTLKARFLAGRQCVLAASTHQGEEVEFLDAVAQLSPRPALVIAPRHPERAAEILAQLMARGLSVAQRSADEVATADTDVLLADTIGEMGLWYRLADAIFLGGASAEGVGGHNPVEPLQLGKHIITGPHGFNFAELFAELDAARALTIVADAPALARALTTELSGTGRGPDTAALERYFARSAAPMDETVRHLLSLLNREGDL